MFPLRASSLAGKVKRLQSARSISLPGLSLQGGGNSTLRVEEEVATL